MPSDIGAAFLINRGVARGELMAGLPVVRTGNIALDRFLEAVREYIETSKGGGNPQSKDRVLRVSDIPALIQLVEQAPAKPLTQSEVESLAQSIQNTRLFQSLTSDGSALAGVVDGYPREVLADVRATAGKSQAGVTTEAIVSATDTQALAAQVTTVTARLDDFSGTASIEEAYLALADRSTGLEAQYTLKVRAGGAIAGIGLAASSPNEGGASSSVIISADKFAVVPAGASGLTGSKIPFTINTGTDKINFTADVEIDGSLKVRSTALALIPGTSNYAAIMGDNGSTAVGATGVYGNSRYGVYGHSSKTGGDGDMDHAGVLASNTGAAGNALWMKGWLRWTNNSTAFDCRISPPISGGTDFLRQDGTWATPAAGAVAWGSITGKPSTFPPDSHTHGYTTPTDVSNSIAANNVTASAAIQAYYASGRTITIPGVGSWSGCSIT